VAVAHDAASGTTHRIFKINDSRQKRLGERDDVVVENDNHQSNACADLLLVAAVAATCTRAAVTPNFSAARLSIRH
jgi:hypothetical protein